MPDIRPAIASDLSYIALIENSAGFNHWSESQLAECLSKNHVWVALVEEHLVAFAVFSLVLDESELLNIAVLPDFQHRGIAKSLLDVSLDALAEQHASQCFLEVARSNTRAVRLYRALGFQEIATRKNYYKTTTGTEDALIMQLHIRRSS